MYLCGEARAACHRQARAGWRRGEAHAPSLSTPASQQMPPAAGGLHQGTGMQLDGTAVGSGKCLENSSGWAGQGSTAVGRFGGLAWWLCLATGHRQPPPPPPPAAAAAAAADARCQRCPLPATARRPGCPEPSQTGSGSSPAAAAAAGAACAAAGCRPLPPPPQLVPRQRLPQLAPPQRPCRRPRRRCCSESAPLCERPGQQMPAPQASQAPQARMRGIRPNRAYPNTASIQIDHVTMAKHHTCTRWPGHATYQHHPVHRVVAADVPPPHLALAHRALRLVAHRLLDAAPAAAHAAHAAFREGRGCTAG